MRPPKSSFRSFHKALADLYDGFGNNITLAAADIPDFSEDVWKRLVEYIFVAKAFAPDMLSAPDVRSAIDETCRILTQGVDSAIKQKVPQELIDHLHNDTFLFSGFKTYHEAREISSLLLDPTTGSFKSFDKFFEEVRSVNERYNQNYLRAEYNFAVQSTQMAVRWHKFEQDGDRYLLQYRTANDGLVRPEHQALHNTTLPIGDPFWNDYTPPLGWNCRCTVVQVNRGKYPESDSAAAIRAGEEATAKPKQQIFRFNPGKTERIFPPKHPYFPKGCGDCQYRTSRRLGYKPDNPMCLACNALAKCLNLQDDQKTARKDILQWAKTNLIGKYTYTHHSLPAKMQFVRNSIGENVGGGELFYAKVDVLNHIKDYLKDVEIWSKDELNYHGGREEHYHAVVNYKGTVPEGVGRKIDLSCKYGTDKRLVFYSIIFIK